LRSEMKKKRLERAMDFSEFYAKEREKLINSKLARPVAKMYLEQKEISPRWWREFVEFWQLPEDYVPKVEELDEYRERVYRKHEELIKRYRKILEERGYDLPGIKHLTLRERMW